MVLPMTQPAIRPRIERAASGSKTTGNSPGLIERGLVGRTGERIFLGELDELERVAHETQDAALGQIARRRRRDLSAFHHAKTRRTMRGLFDEFRLAESHARRQLRARA